MYGPGAGAAMATLVAKARRQDALVKNFILDSKGDLSSWNELYVECMMRRIWLFRRQKAGKKEKVVYLRCGKTYMRQGMNSNEVPCWNMKHHACRVFYIFPKTSNISSTTQVRSSDGQVPRWPHCAFSGIKGYGCDHRDRPNVTAEQGRIPATRRSKSR